MLGILFGTACLIGLFKVARGGRYGHGHWGGGCGGYGGYGGRRGFRRGGWMLRGIFERLETTPGQERVILDAVDEVRGVASKLHEDTDQIRKDVAEALRGAHLDQEKIRDVFSRFDGKAEDVKKVVMSNLAKIHEALDERQRAELASLLESFGRYRRWSSGPGYVNC
jgi:Spy/CpxP family protein refolding chaperone